MRLKTLASAAMIAAILAGCASNRKDQKSAAKEEWGHARASVMLALARDQFNSGNFDTAHKTVVEAIAMDPTNEPLRVLAAKLAIESGELEVADKQLAEARKLNAKDPEADYLSGVVCQRWQRPEDAYSYYSTAADKSPDELIYLMAKSEMLQVLGRDEEALRLLQGKVIFFENSAAIRDAVGQLLMHKKEYDQAIDMFRQATILSVDDMTLKEHLGFALFYGKHFKEAIEPLRTLAGNEKYAKRSDILLALARCQIQTGDLHQARMTLENAGEIDPKNVDISLTAAQVALQQNNLERAELSLHIALSNDPSRPETRLLLGYLKLKQNHLKDALAEFRRASQLDATDTVSLCMVGYTLGRLGQTSEALRCFTHALAIKPGDDMAARMMAAIDLQD